MGEKLEFSCAYTKLTMLIKQAETFRRLDKLESQESSSRPNSVSVLVITGILRNRIAFLGNTHRVGRK